MPSLAVLQFEISYATTGCMDELATNYNSIVEIDDGTCSRRRECHHFADTPFPSISKPLLKGEGGAAAE